MRTNKLKPWAALLAVIGGMAISTQAQNFVVTSDITVSGTHYENKATGNPALTNSGTWTFTGSNVTLTGTAASGSGRLGANFSGGGKLSLTDSEINATLHGIQLTNTSAATLTNTVINSGSAPSGNGVNLASSSTLTMIGGAITTGTTGSQGVYAIGASYVSMRDTVINSYSHGIYISGTSGGDLGNLHITTQQDGARGLNVRDGSIVSGSNLRISTVGNAQANGISVTSATATLSDIDIETSGDASRGIVVEGDGYLQLESATINTTGSSGIGILVASTGGTLNASGLAINTTGYGAYGMYAQGNGTITAAEVNITTAGDSATGAWVGNGTNAHMVINSGTISVSGSTAGVAVTGIKDNSMELNDVKITATGPESNGVIVNATGNEGAQTLTVNGGSIESAQNDAIRVNATSGDVALNITLTGVTVSGSNALNVSENSTLTVQADNSTLSGNVTASGSSVTTVNLGGSTIMSDITQNDDSSVTIELHNASTGTGGFNGGNLNVNDGNSLWTFDKDSHVNNALNNGTLNIGSQDVTFDHLTNNGQINLDLNTDTGAGGSVAVTGTAAGNGSIHVDAIGNGSKDPNSMLPGLVSGDGTENWTWDPVDWGLEKVIKDGDRFVRDGISSAGAVLNSSNALQQAMWFAQQNSLLKRMGELRFAQNSEERKVKSGDGLIENVWIRSYGQQLNVGGKVSGHSYEQMVYGVDLGTDHRWTLDDHNVIYTGVYAGYGRSDIDYRVANTDGELNSYYGGIYATWLHDSGLYVDLTFKAASVDNELKAPYGANQLTADYNDLNLGGSIEIGRKFTFRDDWFIEPQAQVNYLHILAEDYTAGPINIQAQDLDAIQFRVGSLFGRTIKLANGGAIQPYLKVSGVEMVSSGGAIRNGYQSIRSNIDGARAELGGGIIWQMDDQNQLHFDYEASFGDKYDKPWGLTAGFRHQF